VVKTGTEPAHPLTPPHPITKPERITAMTFYLLSVHGSDAQAMPDESVMQQMFADVDALNQKIKDSGSWVFACGLCPASTATVVQQRDGESVMTDGPFLESKEHLGGFWIIQSPDLDAALEWARQATVACQGPVEVRPMQDDTAV
jgi:hypothetical protein